MDKICNKAKWQGISTNPKIPGGKEKPQKQQD